MVKKKVDPADGQKYSFAELEAHYLGKYSKKEIQRYWDTQCKAEKATAQGSKEAPASPAASPPAQPSPPRLVRSRSWLKKVCGIPLLPCEESLAPLLETFHQGDAEEKQVAHLELLRRHPFVDRKLKEVPPEALAAGVSVQVENFRLQVFQFRKWLKTSEGRPFEEKGKGFDDGLYLTSALLRKLLPRGYTNFRFSKAGESEVNVVLRGFLKFTGLTAADEDEESRATEDASAFLFHGYTMDDAQRFLVTTKSNGENGKYTFRRVYGDWYCFAGSKNTGHTWRLGSDVDQLFPIPVLDVIAGVGPKIISFVDQRLKAMPEAQREELLEDVHKGCVTIMVELNDQSHEHIFPIEETWVDHVAILKEDGFPWPQHDAYGFFDRFNLRRVRMDAYDDMKQLPQVMDEIRKDTTTEGAVLYLERSDGVAIGLLKVKSDHYVIARRTRETLRSTLVKPMSDMLGAASVGGAAKREAILEKTGKRLKEGMSTLTHVASWSPDTWPKWSAHALDLATSWMTAFTKGDDVTRRAVVIEYHNKFGSLYDRFWRTQEVLPLSDFSLETAKIAPTSAVMADMPTSPVSAMSGLEKEQRPAGKGKGGRRRR